MTLTVLGATGVNEAYVLEVDAGTVPRQRVILSSPRGAPRIVPRE